MGIKTTMTNNVYLFVSPGFACVAKDLKDQQTLVKIKN